MYAITQKNGYYGSVSNASGAWWSGLAALVAGVIAIVHLDKNWVLGASLLNFAAFGIALAGAAIDGIVAVQVWYNAAMCISLNQNIPSTSPAITLGVNGLTEFTNAFATVPKNLDALNAQLTRIGSPNALIDKYFTNTNQNTNLYKWYALYCGLYTANGSGAANKDPITTQANNLFNQNNNQVYCAMFGYDKLEGIDAITRNNQYCYQISTQPTYNINDLARILPVLQASVAINVLIVITSISTAVCLAWVYTWIHPADSQGSPMLVGIDPKGLQLVSPPAAPLAPPYPALPPAQYPSPPPPPTSAAKIDLKPLGQIK